MQFHEMPNDRQSQTKTPMCASRRSVCLPETFEDVRKKIRFNSFTGIANHYLDV